MEYSSNLHIILVASIYYENYGPDHCATYSEWSLQPQDAWGAMTRKAYERADWTRIGEEVVQQMGPWKEIKTS